MFGRSAGRCTAVTTPAGALPREGEQADGARPPRLKRETPACARPARPGQDALMELTKHGHACVVLSEEGRRLVIDPGAFPDPSGVEGASAVLVTHEHADHVVPDQLRAALEADPALEVWTNGSVAGQFEGLGT